MTASIAVRVTDGAVLAADSQTSMVAHARHGPEMVNSYRHGRKVFALDGPHQAAVLQWGAATIGGLSFPNLLHAAAAELTAPSPLSELADHLVRACNHAAADPHLPAHNPRPDYGILLIGYGPDDPAPQARLLQANAGHCAPARTLEQRLFWAGDGCEALERLILGRPPGAGKSLDRVLRDADLTRQALRHLEDDHTVHLVHPEMPLPDAVELARFLLHACHDYTRFVPGVGTVGGDLILATLTRHHGFTLLDQGPETSATAIANDALS